MVHDEYKTALDNKPKIAFSKLGAPTSPQTANQIEQLGGLLNQGMENVEIGTIQPEVFDQIPKQHFDELRRLAKLSDAKLSVHAPITGVDIAGFSEKGAWSETERKQTEEQVKSFMERAHQLDPEGNIPVVVHSNAGIPAYQYEKGLEKNERALFAINQDSFQIQPLVYKERYEIGAKEKSAVTPRQWLDSINRVEWDEAKLKMFGYQKQKDELRDRTNLITQQNESLIYGQQKGVLTPEEQGKLAGVQKQIELLQRHQQELDSEIGKSLIDMNNKFRRFYKKEGEDSEANQVIDNFEEMAKRYRNTQETRQQIVERAHHDMEAYKDDKRRVNEVIQRANNELSKLPQPVGVDEMLNVMAKLPSPEVWKPVDEFAAEKASQTVSNVAFDAFKKFGESAPVVCIENFMPETVLSRAESLRDMIKQSRQQFAEKLVKEQHMSEDEAKKTAAKLIGATWDLGHINMLRKLGYTEKEIVEETKKLAPFVKHLHVTDNFGFNDSHLPPGMGNVPIKQHLEELEKAGKLDEMRQIIEAGAFVQQFKEMPTTYALEFYNSPLYTYKAAPYWRNIAEGMPGGTGSYFSGYGEIMPEQHFGMYGGGFSALPKELGGEVSGKRSRFSQTEAY